MSPGITTIQKCDCQSKFAVRVRPASLSEVDLWHVGHSSKTRTLLAYTCQMYAQLYEYIPANGLGRLYGTHYPKLEQAGHNK